MHGLVALLLGVSLHAAPITTPEAVIPEGGCPDTGATTFYKAEDGFQGFRLEGDASYRSYFPGSSWEKVPEGPPGRAEFWLDGLYVGWNRIGQEEFLKAPSRTDREVLDAYYRWEFGYLTEMARTGKVSLGDVETYEPFEKRGNDGKTRLFKIWRAMLGSDKKGPQFWVATPHPRGAIVLTLIVPQGASVKMARKVIDTYVANLSSVDDRACALLRREAGRK